MDDSIWSPPAPSVDAETARRAVQAQHEEIRGLLHRAQKIAEAALDGRSPRPDAVASAIGDIRATMEVHLDFEENVLVPFFERDVPLGPERARQMREEHRDQRAMLERLHNEALTFPLLPTLSAKLAFLTSLLLADMDEEERTRMAPDVLRDDQIAVDQSDG